VQLTFQPQDIRRSALQFAIGSQNVGSPGLQKKAICSRTVKKAANISSSHSAYCGQERVTVMERAMSPWQLLFTT
jgi:hypothetical protein